MPKVHVYDLKVQPVVNEAVLNADLLVTMQMRGEGKARLTLTGSRNYSVLEEKEEQIIFSEELPVSEGEVHFEKEVKNRICGVRRSRIYTRLRSNVLIKRGEKRACQPKNRIPPF